MRLARDGWRGNKTTTGRCQRHSDGPLLKASADILTHCDADSCCFPTSNYWRRRRPLLQSPSVRLLLLPHRRARDGHTKRAACWLAGQIEREILTHSLARKPISGCVGGAGFRCSRPLTLRLSRRTNSRPTGELSSRDFALIIWWQRPVGHSLAGNLFSPEEHRLQQISGGTQQQQQH